MWIIEFIEEERSCRWDGAAWKPSRELAASRPARHGESMAPAAQERTAPDPQPGGSYDTRRPWRFAIACSRVQRLCRQSSSEQVSYCSFPHNCKNLLTPRFLLSKSNPLRWASIWFETDGREYPDTALVLTEFKTKERQVSADRRPQSWKCLCPGVPVALRPVPTGRFLRKSSGNSLICQWVDCAYWDYL